MPDRDALEDVLETVRQAFAASRPLVIRGAGTKSFLVQSGAGDALDLTRHCGVMSHEPTELTITARAGTPVSAVEELLGAHGQRLPFEPPFADRATIGGTVSAGVSGPRRPWDGAVRDAVLGVTLINGEGRHLRFGGEVMKNVAGYDVSRLVCGAFGALGVLTSVSLRVLPLPEAQRTLSFELARDEALARVNAWARSSLPLSATYHHGALLRVRLSGTQDGVAAAARQLGGAMLANGDSFWKQVRDQRGTDFLGKSLWRFSMPPAAPYPSFGDDAWITEWAGGLRWYCAELEPEAAFSAAKAVGGHAARWRGGPPLRQPLEPGLAKLHRRLKDAFDPGGILNPGRIYPEL